MSTSGSMTHAAFKKTQLDHVIDVILETAGDPDHAYHCIADQYPTDNVKDYMNLDRSELDTTNLTKSMTTDTVTISNAIDRILTYGTLLDVLWQMYHAWITYGTVRRID